MSHSLQEGKVAANVLVAYYSTYGHVYQMARAVEEGARTVADTDVRLRRIPELAEARRALSAQEFYVKAQEEQRDIPEATHDDLRWADGIAWGTPTGNRVARFACALKSLCAESPHGRQAEAMTYRAA